MPNRELFALCYSYVPGATTIRNRRDWPLLLREHHTALWQMVGGIAGRVPVEDFPRTKRKSKPLSRRDTEQYFLRRYGCRSGIAAAVACMPVIFRRGPNIRRRCTGWSFGRNWRIWDSDIVAAVQSVDR